ncbi:MAG: MBL fold metallo-hydrolase [Firmicutes bacterium HGW-Firmicutes-15]|nr:MAG: MBL fold metallo-hydrolase [Firmicutes bacterium HGW-Firmicutes-15]
MIEEILPCIYLLQIPLPGNPLKTLNSYLIKGRHRSLLIDTGFNWPECLKAQLKGIADLGLNWSEVDFFITHVHGDHSGLVYTLATKDSAVYCSRVDADIMRACMTADYWMKVNGCFTLNGFPKAMISNQGETITNFISGSDMDFTYVQDADIIEVGSYHLVCTATPGHSPGHMCLYEPEHKFFISGDHILAHITSNITHWDGVDDSLGDYLASLDKIDDMDIRIVLPGHREIIHDHHERIAELKHHHANRLQEILYILTEGTMSAYQVASLMHWDMTYDSWDDFPSFQKWFATGEAIAHLDYLVKRHKVLRIQEEQKLVYTLFL